MHDQPYEHDGFVSGNFSEFLRVEFTYTPDSYAAGPQDVRPNPVRLWAAKVDSYRELTMLHANLTHLDLFDEDALTARLKPLTSAGGFFPAGQTRVLIDPVLEAAVNDKEGGAFSRSEFDAARDYEASRKWLQCARPRQIAPRPPPFVCEWRWRAAAAWYVMAC